MNRWLFWAQGLRNAMRLAVIGSAIGLGASFYLLGLLKKMLPTVPGGDPRYVIALSGLLIVVALAASWLPALRATKVSPTLALRSD